MSDEEERCAHNRIADTWDIKGNIETELCSLCGRLKLAKKEREE